MFQPDVNGAIEHAIGRLRAELSPQLTYHNVWHTESDVMPSAMRLARLNQVPEDDGRLLQVAAAYHDIGFIQTRRGHEFVGARITANTLPRYGFSTLQIDAIVGMILATRLPQSPANLLEAILADADLDVLGRDDFFARNEALHQELTTFSGPVPRRQWIEMQITFLKEHAYFTPPARALRDAGKQKHIALLEAQLQQV